MCNGAYRANEPLFLNLLPLQGFSGMNRFNQSTWSKVQCEMILAFLSFADYFRPKYFLLENVRNIVSFNKGQTFRLTLASLLEMGYQVYCTSLPFYVIIMTPTKQLASLSFSFNMTLLTRQQFLIGWE